MKKSDLPYETDRLLRLRSVLNIIPVSRSAFYSGIASGRFPPPVKIGRNSFWRLSDLLNLVERGIE